jgi:hypothetical protein
MDGEVDLPFPPEEATSRTETRARANNPAPREN